VARNLELKIKLKSFNDVQSCLKAANIWQEEILRQQDTYYKWSKGLLKLRSVNGRYELIKYSRDEVNRERWSDYFILNITSTDAEGFLDDILEVEAVVKKTRQLFLYKNTRIHLDDVFSLGLFLELETVVNESLDMAKNEFEEVVKILNLDISQQIKGSYRNLIMQK
jgi:predicted adenylyl cyclase CyaB